MAKAARISNDNTLETTEKHVGGPGPIDNRGNHNAPTVDEDKVNKYKLAELMEEHDTKSAVIRFLSSQQLSRSEIVKVFNNGGDPIRYQHVRSVLIAPVKANNDQ